jgi:ERCC4-type nuclease
MERAPFTSLGPNSPVPEQMGCDFLLSTASLGLIGIQRKAIPDLIASLHDGRVAHELFEQKGLDICIWMLEGTAQWSNDGCLLNVRTEFTQASWHGLLLSLQLMGYWVVQTDSTQGSMSFLSELSEWAAKPNHNSLLNRPGPPAPLGRNNLSPRDWQIHFMQGLPGLGYTRAAKIVDHFSGLPVRLVEDVREVAGVGPGLATKIEALFPPNITETGETHG